MCALLRVRVLFITVVSYHILCVSRRSVVQQLFTLLHNLSQSLVSFRVVVFPSMYSSFTLAMLLQALKAKKATPITGADIGN